MNANERIKEIENKIYELEIEIHELSCEKNKLYKENVQYFIGNILIGDGNYWDEYLWPIGVVTEEEARNWAKENNPEQDIDEYWMGSKPAYFAVSKEEFNLYKKWNALKRAGILILSSKADDQIYELICSEIGKIRAELGIKRSYIHMETGRP